MQGDPGRGRQRVALVCAGVWLHAADSMLVATMMPSIVADIGGEAMVAWTIALYEIGTIVVGACGGLLALRFRLPVPMTAAAALFAIGCLVSATAPSMPAMLLGRALQGLGGGGLMTLSFIAVTRLFPRERIAPVMAVISAVWGTSAFLGPLVGGAFVELSSWRHGFAFFAVQALLLAMWIPRSLREAPSQPPVAGTSRAPVRRLLLLCVSVVSIAYAGIEVSWLRSGPLVGLGIVCLLVFLKLDAGAGEGRLLPASSLDPRHPAGAVLLMVLCMSAATVSITAYGPLLMTLLHDTPALVAGYLVACASVGWSLAAVIVARQPEARDPVLIGVGMSLVTATIAGFAHAVPVGPVWLVAVFSLLEGAGFGMCWAFILRRATRLVREDEVERISGGIPTVQRLGYALGAAYVGIVVNAAGFTRLADAATLEAVARTLFLACLPLAVAGLLAAGVVVRAAPHR